MKQTPVLTPGRLPDYGTIDLGMNYRFNITKDIRAIVYSNVYNLTNTEYIADAKDGTNHDWKTALVYLRLRYYNGLPVLK